MSDEYDSALQAEYDSARIAEYERALALLKFMTEYAPEYVRKFATSFLEGYDYAKQRSEVDNA